MTHLIEKQTVELRLKRADDAFELQQRMSAFCNNQLMPALENLFNRLAPAHKHIRLDKLVIDLGNVPQNKLMSKDFLDNILQQIERKIEAQILDNQAIVIQEQETNVFKEWLYFLENGRLPWFSHGLPPNFETEIPAILARSEAAILELRHLLIQQPNALNRLIRQHKTAFLALITGIFTASVQSELVEIDKALRQFKGQNEVETYWHLVFKRVIFQREKWTATDLIVRTLGDFLDFLAKKRENITETANFSPKKDITTRNKVDFAKTSADTERSILRDLLPDDFPFLAKTEAFLREKQPNNAWILREKAADDAQIAAAFLSKNKEKKNDANTTINSKTGENSEEKKNTENTIINSKTGENSEEKMVSEQEEKTRKIDNWGSKKTGNTEGSLETKKNVSDSSEERDKVTDTTNLDGKTDFYKEKTPHFDDFQAEMPVNASEVLKEMYVSNAGIVLLNPFLSRLFDNLKLTKDGRFINQAMRHKALGILHYLATGEAAVLEYNLTLAKLLCQMPFNQSVVGHWVLSKKEKKECDKLLGIAIDYWSALGKTSKEGLREAFLQRKGKLINRSSGWVLQVERTTIDVLIDRLPWGLGIVKLPWMKDILVVEW